MNSKIKLDFITSRLTNRDLNQLSFINLKTGENISMNQCIENIKKDLDLLEVLKGLKPLIKVYQYIQPDNWVLEIGERIISLDEKEKEILQEWLENE